jgi:hypothetical protein
MVHTYQSKLSHDPEDRNKNRHLHENLTFLHDTEYFLRFTKHAFYNNDQINEDKLGDSCITDRNFYNFSRKP